MSDSKVWVVGRANQENSKEWAICGVFESEDQAAESCKKDDYFIAPLQLNFRLPDEDFWWTGLYYPTSDQDALYNPSHPRYVAL